jgi:hypothetical protein
MIRREFIAGLGGTAACALAARGRRSVFGSMAMAHSLICSEGSVNTVEDVPAIVPAALRRAAAACHD